MTRDKEFYAIQADFCKAMAHPVRIEVINLLKRGERAVKDLASEIGVGQANLSQHLAVLRARGVVRAARRGNEVVYSLTDRRIVDACGLIREILSEQVVRQQSAIAR